MKINRTVSILTVLIMVLAGVCAMIGLFSNSVHDFPNIVSTYGEHVELYQIGLYARDSVSVASQALAQDLITLVVGIPLLMLGLYLLWSSIFVTLRPNSCPRVYETP